MEAKDFPDANSPKAKRLLIVDDSRSIRNGLCIQLENAGFSVGLAKDGKAALEKIYRTSFDLVLLDVVMPGMDGMRVLDIIRHSFSKLELPVIMATSLDTADEVARALDLGANDYVTKPLEPIVLIARIENQLLQKQAASFLKTARIRLKKEIRQRTAQLEEANQKLNYQANYDLLTGLPNRALAYDRLQQMLKEAQRNNHELAVMFVDLDNFKAVNDTLGHAVGDKLLKEAADRLTGCVRGGDTVSRLGGDEFLLVLGQGQRQGHSCRLDVTPIAMRILDEFSKPFIIGEREVSVGTSLGVATFPFDGENAGTLMANADVAMYQSKSGGRHALSFFSKDLARAADRRMLLEMQLRHALERDEMYLLYQPIVSGDNSRVVKFEALLRWESDVLGYVYPDEFISLAESTGQIVPIGTWVLEKACEKLKDWRGQGEKNLRAAVNISAAQFRKGVNLVDIVTSVLDRNGLPPDALELEITEGLFLHDTPEISNTLSAFAGMGVRLSLDDFGTGYSALSYLRRFNFDVLKIDRSFIQDILVNEQDATLVNAIIAMAHGMGLEVVAEGVEEEAQIHFLQQRNCDFIQGYFFSRPLPEGEFLDFLNQKGNTEKRITKSSVVPLNELANTEI